MKNRGCTNSCPGQPATRESRPWATNTFRVLLPDRRPGGAILQLEIALKKPGMNFYDSSRLESRLADLKSEQDDEKERKREAVNYSISIS